MEFTIETEYTAKNMAVMARVLRKTVRKKRSRRSHGFGWTAAALGALLVVAKGVAWDFRTVVTLGAVLAIISAMAFEDRWNGYFARKRLLPGTEKAVTVFSPDGFSSTTDVGKTQWNYDKIQLLAETETAFVFVFSENHGQVYDKTRLQGGSPEEFRCFLEETTGKSVQFVK